jgi:hypothetical protein
MATFVPNSTFGRKVLRNVFEREATYISAWLLNVPNDAPGDRTTWTWADNWKNYRIDTPFAYTTQGTVLDMDSQGPASLSAIELFEEGVHVSPGAYYTAGPGATADNRNTYIYNIGTEPITFTHYAVFTQEYATTSLRFYALADADRTNKCLAMVTPYTAFVEDPEPVTLGPNQYIALVFDLGVPSFTGGSCSNFKSYEDMVLASQAFIEDVNSETRIYADPNVIGLSGFIAINQNNRTSPYFTQAYINTLGFNPGVTSPVFIAELLNVTDSEPAFDAPWSSWAPYSIQRYALAAPTFAYSYAEKEGSYTYMFDGDTYGVTLTSDVIRLKDTVEFEITAPGSSSFTYTHIAVFLLPTATLPPPGQAFVHTDTDAFVGTIKPDSTVTMTTTSTRRAYPFNLSLAYNPKLNFELL